MLITKYIGRLVCTYDKVTDNFVGAHYLDPDKFNLDKARELFVDKCDKEKDPYMYFCYPIKTSEQRNFITEQLGYTIDFDFYDCFLESQV